MRAFLAAEIAEGRFDPSVNSWSTFDPAFSRACGSAGYIGMSWPKQYGGHERSALERYVVTEEMLAGGAPVGAHWVADRQSGHQILRHGSERARRAILPRIAAGECYLQHRHERARLGLGPCRGAHAGAKKVDGGWKISGTKVWTSGAHLAHYLIALVRTAPQEEDRHAGLTQFIVDLSEPGRQRAADLQSVRRPRLQRSGVRRLLRRRTTWCWATSARAGSWSPANSHSSARGRTAS